VQVLDTGSTVVYPAMITPSITVTTSGDQSSKYGSKATKVEFDVAEAGFDSECFELVDGMVKCKKKGNYEASFKIVSKFEKSNRTRQHSKSRLAKFDASKAFIEYVRGSTSPCFHRNGTDGIGSMVCSPLDIQMEAGEHIGVIAWRHSGRYDLAVVPDGSSLSVKLTKELF